MTDEEFEAWEAEQVVLEAEEKNEKETAPGKTEKENETVLEDENRPESESVQERDITVDITWDVPNPVVGDTAHFKATLDGYDGLDYSIQWQYSPDCETWYDLINETNETMDVVVTEENNKVYWRILVYVEDERENDF